MNLMDLLSGGYNPGAAGGGNLFGGGFGGGGTNNLFNNGGGQAGGGFLSALLGALQGQQQGTPANVPLTGPALLDSQRQGLFGAGARGAFGGGGLDTLSSNVFGGRSEEGSNLTTNTGQPGLTSAPSTPIFNSRPLSSIRPFGAVY